MSLLSKISSSFGQASRQYALVAVAILSGVTLSQPAFAADVTVASPVNGTTVSSPIWVRAHNVGCNSLAPTAFGYTVDDSSTVVPGATKNDIDAVRVSISSGTHTIHFKSWTSAGACPTVSTTFKVDSGGTSSSTSGDSSSFGTSSLTSGVSSSPATSSSIPSNAVGSANLDGMQWSSEKDSGTPGSGRGSTAYPATTPSYDDAREFYMTYSAHGGVRWHLSFAKDPNATHFVYDSYVYFTDPSQVANLEMDMNQVMSDGATVIFGTQCSSYSRTWEYTIVSGGSHWKSSNIPCNPKNWAANTWHHVQIASHRNSNGDVTYDWVNVDGTHSTFQNATGFSAEKLGWAKGDLLVNFQLDGASSGSGSVKAYIHKMTVYRW